MPQMGGKRLLANWGGSMLGVILGGLGGEQVFHMIQNPALASLLGVTLGATIGFGAVDVIKLFYHPHKAQ